MKSYFSNPFGGPIPSCIWSMSNLATLHLDGNGHTGSLPSHINFPQMTNLNIKLNNLQGDIGPLLCLLPKSDIDVSNNKFAFTLDRNTKCPNVIERDTGNLKAGNNRISGKLPSYLSDLQSVSVLGGQATQFECSYFSHDELASQRSCIRNLYLWLSVVRCCSIILGSYWSYHVGFLFASIY